MPYKSEKQRRLMHAKHPGIAARWDKEYGSEVKKSAWGIVHKGSPDQSALHIPGNTMRVAPRARLRKVKKKTTEL